MIHSSKKANCTDISSPNDAINIQIVKKKQILKGCPDPSHFIFEINVGKSRIRHRTILNLNDLIFSPFWVDEDIQFQSRSMSDPTLSDIDFKNKIAWVWSILNQSLMIRLTK